MNTPTTHAELECELRALLSPEFASRPFVSSGSPFGCEIALVGVNPATTTPFWAYWNTATGFHREGWIASYQSEAANRKNQTRPRIERLVSALHPLRVIELNAYPYSTPNERAISPSMRDTRVFEVMLRVAKPRIIFAFGKKAAYELGKLIGVQPLAVGVHPSQTYAGVTFTVVCESHLSRGWSYARVGALANSIKQLPSGAGV